MNALAVQLNEKMQQENPAIFDMLSDLGKNLYYPKGILSQSAEAGKKAHRFNATIGIATENGEPMHFRHIQEKLDYKPKDIYPYAPPQGKQALRLKWKEKQFAENPSMQNKSIGITNRNKCTNTWFKYCCRFICRSRGCISDTEQYWGNYNTVFQVRRGGKVETFPIIQ